MSNLALVITLILLIVLTAAGTFYLTERGCQDTLKMQTQSKLAREITRAEGAYSTQSLVVAKWELEQLEELLNSSHLSEFEDERRITFNKFVAAARLAKVHRELGNVDAVDKYVDIAIRHASPFHAGVTNAESLFQTLADGRQEIS